MELGLHPRLTGLKSIFDAGRLAIVQRTGYANSEPIALSRASTSGARRAPSNTQGTGWLGRYLDTLPPPVDPLVAWNTQRETPRPLMARTGRRAGDHEPGDLRVRQPEHRRRGRLERTAQTRISSHLPVDRPHLAFVNSTTQAALGTLDRVATVATYRPARHLSEQRLRAGAAGGRRRDEQADRHARCSGSRPAASTRTPAQGANQGAYFNLMATLSDGLKAFYDDLSAQGMLNNTLVLVYSEFGRRITRERQPGHRSRRRRRS